MEQEKFFNDEEKKKFEEFALALDSAIVNKYHGVLQELKASQLLPFFSSPEPIRLIGELIV